MTRAMGTTAEKVREFIAHYNVGEEFTLSDIKKGVDVEFKPRVSNPNTVELGCITGPIAELVRKGVVKKSRFILKGKRKIRTYKLMTNNFNIYTNRPTTQGGTLGRTWEKDKPNKEEEYVFLSEPTYSPEPEYVQPQVPPWVPQQPLGWLSVDTPEKKQPPLSLQAQLAEIVEKLKGIIDILEQPAENFLHELSTADLFKELERRVK